MRGSLTLTFNRPKANALNGEMALETLAALRGAAADPEVRVIVITGSGRFFCAGQDMGDFESSAGKISYRKHLEETYNPLVLQMQATPKPIVGGINGPAVGAGLGLALACDLRVATNSAQFRYGFTRYGPSHRRRRRVLAASPTGYAPALAMAMLDEPLEAAQAYRMGLVSRIFTEAEFPFGLLEIAHRLAHSPTKALGLTKRVFLAAQHSSLESALDLEVTCKKRPLHPRPPRRRACVPRKAHTRLQRRVTPRTDLVDGNSRAAPCGTAPVSLFTPPHVWRPRAGCGKTLLLTPGSLFTGRLASTSRGVMNRRKVLLQQRTRTSAAR